MVWVGNNYNEFQSPLANSCKFMASASIPLPLFLKIDHPKTIIAAGAPGERLRGMRRTEHMVHLRKRGQNTKLVPRLGKKELLCEG